MNSTRMFAAILALQGLTLLSVWTGHGPLAPARAEGIPDAGAQRQQVIEELRSVNKRLDQLVQVLESGKLHVAATVVDPKDKSGEPK